ncbi:MMPL family transporter [Yaniella flava]|uniref:MMPL family transporter n=1 Tax=Yaniella flava TaxID=287930 RepID=UPI003CD0C448
MATVGALVALVFLALPVGSLRLGLPDASQEPADSTAYQAYQETEESFGEGMNSPLLVLADLPESDLSEGEATDQQIAVAEHLAQRDDVETAVPTGMNEAHDVIALAIIPTGGPASEATENLVHDLRAGGVLADTDVADVELSVAGAAAASIDISDVVADALPVYLGVVIGLSLLLMIMVFRSLLLPLVATLGFVGSFAATMGVVVAIFQWGWLGDVFDLTGTGPILTFLPILVMGILFGLGMDYQLFTATGMREAYAQGAKPKVAVRKGLVAGRAVVTAAALIMISVFAGFIFTDDVMITSIGLALAVGVLLDAFVVRLLLVPSVLHLLGPAAWWLPKWIDRILPNVDVEGTALEQEVTKRSQGAGI